MKKALLTLAAIAISASAFAQGTILFSNNNIPSATEGGAPYRAGIFRSNGDGVVGNSTVGAGAGFTVGLFLASNLTTPLASTTFRLNNNFEVFTDTTQEVRIDSLTPGQTANLVIGAWETAAGGFANSLERGEQAFTSRALGGANPVPGEPAFFTPGLTGFTGFEMVVVPEPSTIALGALGIGALLLRRRK